MRLQHAISAALLGGGLGLAHLAGGCAAVVGADFSERPVRECEPCTTKLHGPCAAGCMEGDACVATLQPSIEICETEDVDESCDDSAVCDGEPGYAAVFGNALKQQWARIGLDSVGNTLLAIEGAGDINYGTAVLAGTGTYNVHLAKFAADNSYLWSVPLSGGADHHVGGLAVDTDNSVVLTGYYLGQLDLPAPVGVIPGQVSYYNVFVARFEPDKEAVWGLALGGAGNTVSAGLAIDDGGNILLGGSFDSTLNVGASALATAGGSDAFVAKLDATGAPLWACGIGGPDTDLIYDVAAGPGGVLLATGAFDGGTATIGGTTLTGTAGVRASFIVAIDEACAVRWAQVLSAAAAVEAISVTVDPERRVLVAGYLLADLAISTLPPLVHAGGADAFLAAFDLDAGTPLWARRYGDTDRQNLMDVEVDGAGNVLLAGYSTGSVQFGPGTPLMSADTDPVVVKLAPSTAEGPGDPRWSRIFTGTNEQIAFRLAHDPLGNIAVAGNMLGLLSIDGNVLDWDGDHDVWVAKLRP